MSKSIQCQNPLPVGASGSKHVTAKLFVPAGNPSHRRCGEVFPAANDLGVASTAPGARSSLTTVNEGTSGWKSCGSGGPLLLGHVSTSPDQLSVFPTYRP